jgi:hypothetical protein
MHILSFIHAVFLQRVLAEDPSQHEPHTRQDIDIIPKATQLHYVRKFEETIALVTLQ